MTQVVQDKAAGEYTSALRSKRCESARREHAQLGGMEVWEAARERRHVHWASELGRPVRRQR